MTYTSLNELLRSRIELMIDTQRNYGWGARQAGQLKLTTIQTSGIELASDGESTVRKFCGACVLDLAVRGG